MVWTLITNLGDSAVTLPSVVIILVWLLDARAWRLGIIWGFLCAFALGMVALTKIAFIAWGIGIEAIDFTGISGHSTISMLVYTTAAFLLTHRLGARVAIRAMGIGVLVGLLVGCSRLQLRYHSLSEVVAGVFLGAAAAGAFISQSRRLQGSKPAPGPILGIALMVPMVFFYGQHAPTEAMITRIALLLSGHTCPFTRESYSNQSCSMPPGRLNDAL